MSSFARRIQRTVSKSQPVPQYQKKDGTWHMASNSARNIHFNGRGSKLGVTNPNGRELIARLAREERHSISAGE